MFSTFSTRLAIGLFTPLLVSPMNALPNSTLSVSNPVQWFVRSKLPTRLMMRLLGVVLGLVIVTMASAAAALQQGDQGGAVQDLQNRLSAVSCYSGPSNGNFGALTRAGVITCQQKYGLVADGIVGPQTVALLDRLAMGEVPSSRSQPVVNAPSSAGLQNGSRGEAVISLQRQLKNLGFDPGELDGVFGPMTQTAVVKFQQRNGLVQSGVFGSSEQSIIATAAPVQTAQNTTTFVGRQQLTVGDQGKDVKLLQQRLSDLAHFESRATGYFGGLTKSAVSSFQTASRIPVTGVADPQTLRSLGLAGAGAQALNTQPANDEGFNRSGFTATPIEDGFNRSGFTTTESNSTDPANRFVVIIPKQDGVSLSRVRQVVPEAIEGKSSIGSFIQAGAFSSQQAAADYSQKLQAYNFNARVAYR
jgi:peptidoglycan hydrolase-like protein with peptidoglycan-binding domain